MSLRYLRNMSSYDKIDGMYLSRNMLLFIWRYEYFLSLPLSLLFFYVDAFQMVQNYCKIWNSIVQDSCPTDVNLPGSCKVFARFLLDLAG